MIFYNIELLFLLSAILNYDDGVCSSNFVDYFYCFSNYWLDAIREFIADPFKNFSYYYIVYETIN